MSEILLGAELLFVAGGLVALAATLVAARRTTRVTAASAEELREWPLVSVVVPARDEEESIEATLRALLAVDYPAIEIVAVDDRSTDATGELMRAVAAEDDRVVVLRIDELPDGWLGKTNAMARATERARGDWLLFMDADVELSKDALRQAVAFAVARELDLLSGFPHFRSAGFLLDVTMNSVLPIVALGGRPWQVRDDNKKVFGAFGAFMLTRRAAFLQTDGWEWLRLEVADDMGLGLVMKRAGKRCELALLDGLCAITWYSSVGEMARLMQKNWFGIMGRFSVARVWALAVGTLVMGWLPWAGLLALSQPRVQLAAATGCALAVVTGVLAARWMRRPLLAAVFVPIGLTLVAWMCLRAGWRGLRTGGIEWRGQLYPSAELRAHQRVLL